jgi:pantetheine-phosphate adenylyltransferase
MTSPVIAVFPGTFDPITRGHEDMVQRAAQLFDRVIIAVAAGHHKKTMFSLPERISMVQLALQACPNVQVESFDGLIRDFVRAHAAKVMLRGVRSTTDFEYERQLEGMNKSLMPEVETVFLTPCSQFQFVSSTLVREIATLGGDVDQFVSAGVNQRLRHRVSEQK